MTAAVLGRSADDRAGRARRALARALGAAQVGLLDLGQRGGQRLVAARLLGAERSAKTSTPGRSAALTAAAKLLERGDVHVGVAALAERVGQRLDVGEHVASAVAREARREDLEHGAQPARGDAHVVDALDVGGVEHALGVVEELLGAHGDRARGGLARSGSVGVQARDVACLGHLRASIQLRPSSARRTTPSRRPPRRDLQRRRRRLAPAASSSSRPAGSRRTRSASSSKRCGRPRRPASAQQDGQARASSASASSTRADAAGAARSRCRRRRRRPRPRAASRPSKAPATSARTAASSSARAGRSAGSASASMPEPTGSEADQRDAAAQRADDELGRAAADVDHADVPGRRLRAAPRVAPTKASAPPRSPVSTSTSTPRPRRTAAHERRRGWRAPRIAAVATTRDLARAVAARPRAPARPRPSATSAHSPRRDRAVVAARARRVKRALRRRPRAARAGRRLGDEQPRRVRCRCRCRRSASAACHHRSSDEHSPHLPSRSATCASPTATTRPCAASTSRSPAARSSACSAPTAPARRRRSRSSRATATRTGGDRVGARLRPRAAPARAARAGRDRPAVDRHVPPHHACARRSRTWPRFYPHPRDVDEVIALAGLQEKADAQRATLSGGQLRRLDFALALVGDPELIFLDEPTTGFDPAARRDAWEAIRSLRELGKTVLLTTHYLDEAQALADRVAIIKDGRILAEGAAGRARARRRRATAWRGATSDGELQAREIDDPTALLHELTSAALARGEPLRRPLGHAPVARGRLPRADRRGRRGGARMAERRRRSPGASTASSAGCSGATRRAAFFNFLLPLLFLRAVRRDLLPATRRTST